MKKITIIAISVLSLASCKKCYKCTISVTTTVTPYVQGANASGFSTTEFCGTNKEKDSYVKAGTSTITSYSGAYKSVQVTKTSCQ